MVLAAWVVLAAASAPNGAMLEQVAEATVLVGGGRCAGVLAGGARSVLTAAHCVAPGEQSLDVAFANGVAGTGRLTLMDVGRDVALLTLDAPPGVAPLTIAAEAPAIGDALIFTGRSDRPVSTVVYLERRGRCPTLPSVDALFTTLAGTPGDSGAPLVDLSLQVVGLVHGGATCHIAAPTDGLASWIEDEAPGVGGSPPAPGFSPSD